ncbi:MAG: polysaccharide deacetylase family protein [Bacteroidales bacterium]|nr:polysaccharide deacetylase family protein [Bacteroidales bacterium]
MSELVKHIAAMFPGPANATRHFKKSGLDVIFPFYHAVADRDLMHMKHLYATRTIKQFEADLDYMLKYFQPVKMSEYLEGKVLLDPGKIPMVLSFDDGLIQCYEEVMPILLSKGIPATFFLNNAFIDNLSMFFRFKVSLLIEALKECSELEKRRAAEILHCSEKDIRKRLLGISYVEREITDQVADLWGYSFDEYMRQDPVYLTSIHIRKMLEQGFEFGSHGIDHPLFSLLKKGTTIDHIRSSVLDLKKRYNLDHKFFAFPFTDSGVEDSTIDYLFKNKIIDAGFGTAGMKDDKWPCYFQRIPMEMIDKDARVTLRGELNRRRVRKLTGRNITKRM